MPRDTLRKCAAEFLGTFAIVFFGGGSVCMSIRPDIGLGLVGIALAFGLVVAVMVSSIGHISGAHFNPAVTFMVFTTRRMTAVAAASYVVAQLAGALAAAFVLGTIIGPEAIKLGTTGLAVGTSPAAGAAIEAILTFFLVLVIYGTAIDARGHKLGGIAIGGVVTLNILMAGPLTGASMNPARTFGPALASNHWQHHWVYWVGPMVGALLASLVYEKVLAPKSAE